MTGVAAKSTSHIISASADEAAEQLANGLPKQRILLAQDLIYRHIHLLAGGQSFEALEKLAGTRCDIVLAGHVGVPEAHQRPLSAPMHRRQGRMKLMCYQANGLKCGQHPDSLALEARLRVDTENEPADRGHLSRRRS